MKNLSPDHNKAPVFPGLSYFLDSKKYERLGNTGALLRSSERFFMREL